MELGGLQLRQWFRRPLGLTLGSLGASCCLIFRSLSVPVPLLASFLTFLTSLSFSERICIDLLKFFELWNPPGTSKINENPLVFLGFSLFLYIG